jgi:hypothetical protein
LGLGGREAASLQASTPKDRGRQAQPPLPDSSRSNEVIREPQLERSEIPYRSEFTPYRVFSVGEVGNRNTASPQHCNTATLQHCNTATPHHRNTATPQHRITATLQHRNTATPHHRNTATPQHRNTASLQHCITATPQHRIAATLQHRNTASLHHCITASQTIPLLLKKIFKSVDLF